MLNRLRDIAAAISSPVEKRLFAEYGAIFATAATPPPKIMFTSAGEVSEFQTSLGVQRARIGEHEIALQSAAMRALLSAAAELGSEGLKITARAADAGARSYEDTVGLWARNVTRGLDHWQARGRVAPELAQSIRELDPAHQISPILDLEESEIFFGTFFDRSILHSVAAPGASQHLSLLAFDVAEYEEPRVEQLLSMHGWHRTVPNDLPHFTYLGFEREALPGLGLMRITRAFGERVYGFWIPDLERLAAG
jgi:hypothetical protein